MIIFCRDLKQQAMKIIDTPLKPMTPLTDREKEVYENQYACYIYKKEFSTNKKSKHYKNYKKLEIILIIQANTEELLIVFVIEDIEYQMRYL